MWPTDVHYRTKYYAVNCTKEDTQSELKRLFSFRSQKQHTAVPTAPLKVEESKQKSVASFYVWYVYCSIQGFCRKFLQ